MLKPFVEYSKINENLTSDFLNELLQKLKTLTHKVSRLTDGKEFEEHFKKYLLDRGISEDSLNNDINNVDFDDLVLWCSDKRFRRTNKQIHGGESGLKGLISARPDSILNSMDESVLSDILKVYCAVFKLNYGYVFDNLSTELDVDKFVDWFDSFKTTGKFLLDFYKPFDKNSKISLNSFVKIGELDEHLVDVMKYLAVRMGLVTKDLRQINKDRDTTASNKKANFKDLCNWLLNDMNAMSTSKPRTFDEYELAKKQALSDFIESKIIIYNPDFYSLSKVDKINLINDYIKNHKVELSDYKNSKEYNDAVETLYVDYMKRGFINSDENVILDSEMYNDTFDKIKKIYNKYQDNTSRLKKFFIESLNEEADEDSHEDDTTDDVETETVEIERESETFVEPTTNDNNSISDEDVIKSATKDLLNQLMMDVWAFISKVNSGIITLKSEENVPQRDHIIEILNSVADDSTIIVGMLSKVSSLLDENTLALMQKGEKKADNIIKA